MLACDYRQFTSSDLKAMLNLSGELHELPGDFLSRVRHMLAGLCGLVHAQVALFSDLKDYLPDRRWRIEPLLDFGWAGAAERRACMSFFEGEQLDDPLTAPCTKPAWQVVTVCRPHLVDDRDWYRSANVNELRRRGRVDHCIYSHYRLAEPGRAMGLAFHRPWGDPPFTERERAIVDVFHETQRLYVQRDQTHSPRTEVLTSRQRQVLGYLKAGNSEKEVAGKLGLSCHTIHSHVKALHEHFGVSSRGELLSLWVRSGDQQIESF